LHKFLVAANAAKIAVYLGGKVKAAPAMRFGYIPLKIAK
jgi:GMP synthase-like glutamine amidotransferase